MKKFKEKLDTLTFPQALAVVAMFYVIFFGTEIGAIFFGVSCSLCAFEFFSFNRHQVEQLNAIARDLYNGLSQRIHIEARIDALEKTSEDTQKLAEETKKLLNQGALSAILPQHPRRK